MRAGAAQGLCSRCLLALGLPSAAEPTATGGEPTLPGSPKWNGSQTPAWSTSPAPMDSPGSEIIRTFGDYELLEEIARGGMGVVYRARQRSLGRLVAVKTLLFGPTASPESVQRFRAEAAAAASLHHPNIVAIHEVGVHQCEHYLVMDLVDGPDLATFIKDQPLPAHRAAAYLRTVAKAIHHAHERGILHRDLKPSNVLIDGNDQPRVTDFGLAKRFEGDSSLTLSGRVMGSPHYMPPEQAGATRHKVGRRSDVYALGAMLYHMLVGRPPFVGENLSQTLDQVLHHDPVSPRLVNPGVPRDLETICLKCLEKEPSRRYPTARALAEELGRFSRHEPIQARPLSPPERLWRWARLKPTLAALVVLLHLVGGLGLAGILWEWRRAEQLVLTERGLRESTEAQSYAEDMYHVQIALESGNLGTVHRLLDLHRPLAKAGRGGREPPVDWRNWEWRYFWDRSQSDAIRSLQHGEAQVESVAFSPDGAWLASGDYQGRLWLWELASGRLLASCETRRYPEFLQFLPDGRTLVSAGWEHGLRLWRCAPPRLTPERAFLTECSVNGFWLGPTEVLSVDFDAVAPDGPLADQARLRRWDLSGGRELGRHPVRSYTGFDVDSMAVFSADGGWLATATNQTILLWDTRRGVQLATLTNHAALAHPLTFSHDGRYLVSGDLDGMLKLWDAKTGQEVASAAAHRLVTQRAAFSPDDRLLVTCSYDYTLRLWQVSPFAALGRLCGHRAEVYDVCFSPDGHQIASASADGTVKLWPAVPRPPDTRTRKLPPDVRFRSLAPDGQWLLLVFPDDTLSLWDLRDAKARPATPRRALGATNVTAVTLFAGGAMLALGHDDGLVTLHEASSLRATTELRGLNSAVARFGASLDGRTLVAQGTNHLMQSWSLPAGLPGGTFCRTNHFYYERIPVSPDGRTVVTATEDGLVELWALQAGLRTHAFRASQQMFATGFAFFRDGHRLATCSTDKTAKVWDLNAADRPILTMYSDLNGLRALALSPDERRLAVGDDIARLGRVKVFDLETGREVAVLDGQHQSITDVAFWPDGSAIVAVGREAVCVWRAPSLEEIAKRADAAALRPWR